MTRRCAGRNHVTEIEIEFLFKERGWVSFSYQQTKSASPRRDGQWEDVCGHSTGKPLASVVEAVVGQVTALAAKARASVMKTMDARPLSALPVADARAAEFVLGVAEMVGFSRRRIAPRKDDDSGDPGDPFFLGAIPYVATTIGLHFFA